MAREIDLSGGEISMLKVLGLSGTAMPGKFLVEHMSDLETAEFLDTLGGLLTLGYVLATRVNVQTMEDVERASFRVNPSYSHQLRDALQPNRAKKTERRRRRG